MKGLLLIFIALLVNVLAMAQPALQPARDFERLVDEIFSIQDEDISYEDLYENLIQLYSNPVDVNRITEDQLRSIFVLNEAQIQAFISYRVEAGPILSLYEIQNIKGFDQEVIQRLLPFVILEDKSAKFNKNILNRMIAEKNNYLILRYDRVLEKQKGYLENTMPSGKYAGPPGRMYSRFNTRRTGDFSLGFTMEKDAGEKINWSHEKKYYGADFISFHIQVMNKGKIRNLILGDYQAQFGQGLILGSAFGIGKNAESVTTVRKGNVGFIPYTSVYEARYFRGTAVSYALSKHISINGMYSSRWGDGNIRQDTIDSGYDYATSFQTTGLHRNTSELENRKTILEQNYAGIANYKFHNLESGVIFQYTQFNTLLQPNSRVYNQFTFRGSQNTNTGIFLNYHWRNFAMFSEIAHTFHRGTAVIGGMLGSITPALDISILVRKYDRDFISLYSNALSENTNPQNETGIYWGWKYVLNKKSSFSGYFDLFHFPWLRYRVYRPSEGSEWLLRFNHKPSKFISLFLQIREEVKARNLSSDTNLYLTANGTKRNYWFNIDYQVAPQLSFKTRIQYNTFLLKEWYSDGMVLLQDFTWNHGKFSVSGRYAIFDTDDYENRIYVYEKDAWLSFSFPAYYGSGVKNYLLMQYSFSKKVDVWMRWSHVRYTDRETIGSGGDIIAGNIRNDIKFQIRIRL